MIIYLKCIIVITVIAIGVGVFDKVNDKFIDLPMNKTYLYLTIMAFVGGVIILSIIAFSIWLFSPELAALQAQELVKE